MRAPVEIRRIAAELKAAKNEIGVDLAKRITAQIPLYGNGSDVPSVELQRVSAALLDASMDVFLTDGDVDLTEPWEGGRSRAAVGVPLSVVLEAYRIGALHIWETMVARGKERHVDLEVLHEAATRIWESHGKFTRALTESYRLEANSRLLADEAQRGAMVESLLTGGLRRTTTVWEAADILGFPVEGPFVIVAAKLPQPGRRSMDLENRLAVADVRSAWRLLADVSVGLVACGNAELRTLLAELRRTADLRAGVSPVVTHLGESRDALRLARCALAASSVRNPVVRFEDAPLAVVAAAAPDDVTTQIAASVLGSLATMRADDRRIVLDTFDTWARNGGSTDAAAQALFCHPNTVRQRLRRLEERTGRAVSNPMQVAELCLAVAIEHAGQASSADS